MGKKQRFTINNLSFHFSNLEKEEKIKSKVHRRKEIVLVHITLARITFIEEMQFNLNFYCILNKQVRILYLPLKIWRA